MPAPATGELRPLANGWEARIRIEGKKRRGFVLAAFGPADETAARERCTAMAQIAVRLRRAGHAARTEDLLKMAAGARPGRPWEAVVAAVDVLCSGSAEAITADAVPTFVDFAREWTSGKLHTKFPDHVSKKKDSDADERYLTNYVEAIIGDLAIDAFTLDHADQIMASIPEGRAASTRRHVAQFVRRVCALAVYPARLRKDSPIPRGWLPKVKVTKAFTHLYPDEDRQLLGCAGTEGVPLIRRLFYGVLAREGLRRSELASIRFRDLDLEVGRISLDENKTDDPRTWALDPGVRRALKAWKDRFCPDASHDDYVFAEAGVPLYVNRLAADLQNDLRTAECKREQLYERSASRRPLRAHDLRATFVTVSLANGKTETFVADRTGHRSSAMINRYRRAARTWSELDLGPLAPLDEAIPELRPAPATEAGATAPKRPSPHALPHVAKIISAARARKAKESRGGEERIRTSGTVARSHDFQAEHASAPARQIDDPSANTTPGDGETPRDATAMGHSWGDGDPVEAALARALDAAVEAGEFDVVVKLADDLRARRASGGEVVELATRRRAR